MMEGTDDDVPAGRPSFDQQGAKGESLEIMEVCAEDSYSRAALMHFGGWARHFEVLSASRGVTGQIFAPSCG